MAGGGIWKAQNKVRPGAYINFISKPKPISRLGERGTVAIAVPMIWGPQDELITVYSSDLTDGKSLSKIGCTAFDTELSLPYRLALYGSNTALIFRADKGGEKATKTLTNVTVSAKHPGSAGNNLSIEIVAIKDDEVNMEVRVLYKEVLKETFIAKTYGELELVESEWVVFTATEGKDETKPEATAGTALAGGTNGTVSQENYTKFFELLKRKEWQCMAIQTSDQETLNPLILSFIKECNDDLGKNVQAVCYDYSTADYEGIIKVDQGFVAGTETVSEEMFPLWVAGVTAGANVDESNTAAVVQDATDIIGYYDNNQIIEKLKAGWFVLSDRQDGAIVVEQDINSLHTFTPDKNKPFSKNRVIRTLGEISNQAALVFNMNYKGKVDNNDFGRNLYKSELINILDTLQDMGAVQNFGGAEDISVMQGTDIDAVVVEFTIQPVDAMEKLYMTVEVDG